ncbi:TPA: hypothetical protein R4K21_000900 [Stenotrophomonas maltophilia]|nr:hypothetical protein [Stenotrophomonas maltophilia]
MGGDIILQLGSSGEQGGYSLQIFVGIATGVVTSALLWLAKSVWTSTLHPLLEASRYRGLRIDGLWHGLSFADEAAFKITLNLKQQAHRITGTCEFTYHGRGNEYVIRQDASGELWEGYLSLILKPSERNITSFSACLLKVAGGGVALEGQLTYRNINEERVDSEFIELANKEPGGRELRAYNATVEAIQQLNREIRDGTSPWEHAKEVREQTAKWS